MSTEPFTPSETPQKPARSKTAQMQVQIMLWLIVIFAAGLTIYTVFPEGSMIREFGTAAVCFLILLVMFRGPSSRN